MSVTLYLLSSDIGFARISVKLEKILSVESHHCWGLYEIIAPMYSSELKMHSTKSFLLFLKDLSFSYYSLALFECSSICEIFIWLLYFQMYNNKLLNIYVMFKYLKYI